MPTFGVCLPQIHRLQSATPNTRRRIKEHIPGAPYRFDDILEGLGVREVLLLGHVVGRVVFDTEKRGK